MIWQRQKLHFLRIQKKVALSPKRLVKGVAAIPSMRYIRTQSFIRKSIAVKVEKDKDYL